MGAQRASAGDPRGPERRGARAGTVEFLADRQRPRSRTDHGRIRLHRRGDRPLTPGGRSLQLQRPRHGQHGSARTIRLGRTETRVARAAARRQNPLGLRDDGTGRRVVGRHQHLDDGRARKRRVGHQRRKDLHIGRGRSPLQDPDLHGAHESRCRPPPAALADPGADGCAGRGSGEADGGIRRRPRTARPYAPSFYRRARAGKQRNPRTRPRLRDRAGSPWARPDPPLHACDRHGGKSTRADVRAIGIEDGLRQTARQTGR